MRFIDEQKLQTNHFMTVLEDGNDDLFSRATNHGCSYNYTLSVNEDCGVSSDQKI